MKTGECDIKKLMVLSLLVAYLFIVLGYLFYLPKYSPFHTSNNYSAAKTYQAIDQSGHVKHNSGNILVLLHHVYRSTVENKQTMWNNLFQSIIILVSIVFGSITLLNLAWRTERHSKHFRNSHQYAYLSYCTLRI